MSPKGDANRYGMLAATLHWVSALAILTTIPLGFSAAHASDPARAAALLRLHLPLGLTILGLTLVRAVWWLADSHPAAPADQPMWQHRLARGSHLLLYGLIVLLCGSGIGVVALSHAAPAILSGGPAGLPDLQALPPMKVHAASAFVLISLLILHLSAVAYHQFWRRDRPLARMRVGRAQETAR